MVPLIPVRFLRGGSLIWLNFAGMEIRARKKADRFWSAPMSENSAIILEFLGVCQEIWSYVVSIRHGLVRPHAPVPQAHCDFAPCLYAAPSLCGSASATCGTFPTLASVLSVHVADPTPAARRALPLCSHGDFRLPPPIKESPLAMPVSASNA